MIDVKPIEECGKKQHWNEIKWGNFIGNGRNEGQTNSDPIFHKNLPSHSRSVCERKKQPNMKKNLFFMKVALKSNELVQFYILLYPCVY